MTRDEQLITIRPILDHATENDFSEIETFQNKTLRPLLKMQNDILFTIIEHDVFFKQTLAKANQSIDKLTIVKDYLNKRKELKTLILGAIIGQFTITEINTYHNNTKEYNKRIITMTAQRYYDQKLI